ncbi:MAG: tyrosine-protein phosphatase [Solobacterium sp.]|nr:tyrosine-protein phosphatase [Solobacterium sp.]
MAKKITHIIWKLFLASVLLTGAGCTSAQQSVQHNAHSSGSDKTIEDIETGILGISKYGNIVLTVTPQTMMNYGYEEADIIHVEIGDEQMTMPIGTNYSDVDAGSAICRYDMENTPQYVILAISSGNLASAMNVADKHETNDDQGYEWIWREGMGEDVSVKITMAEKQGYANEYEIHKVTATRTNSRDDYPELSDAQYANFRAVTTAGMGKDTLYRSSSPINPKIGRNKEADEALSLNGIRTVINLADYEKEMKEYPDYASTWYSECSVLPLAMSMDMAAEENRKKLAEGLRYILTQEGPYLIHCLEGKDRTGFVIAILECLMGADIDAVIKDYMVTYDNFYHVKENTDPYEQISAIIVNQLHDAFHLDEDTEFKKNESLQAYAEQYILELGLSSEELEALKTKLSADYGGQQE